MGEELVYHGSPDRSFEIAVPKRQQRFGHGADGGYGKIFDAESFHATPYRWIALAYTVDHAQTFEFDGKRSGYNMGVDLYEHKKEVAIYGIGSVEKSLEKLYGNGGYLYTFTASDFFHTEGLGNLEVITQKEVVPIRIERIDDPVEEMKREGVTFTFFDLSDPANRERLEIRI